MNQPDIHLEIRISNDPRSALLGRCAVVRGTVSERDREILDHISDRYRASLGTVITAEREHTRYRAGLERLLELITTAPAAEVVLTKEELRSAFATVSEVRPELCATPEGATRVRAAMEG